MISTRNQPIDQNTPDQPQAPLRPSLPANLIAGLFTGVFCSGLLNPWDRALYLSVKNNKPFLSLENFANPYHGFSQAVVQRAFLGSIYYILQGELKSHLHPYLSKHVTSNETIIQCCIGLTAGGISGLLTNSISAVKYHTWGQENRSFFSSVYEMWSHGGIQPFIKGTWATIGRDTVFGCTYEVARYQMRSHFSGPKQHNNYASFLFDCLSAGLSTITSGPLNYARTIQYATPPHQRPPSVLSALNEVWMESQRQQTLLGRVSFFQQKFRVGWGTARVAVGMAVGQKVFDGVSTMLKNAP